MNAQLSILQLDGAIGIVVVENAYEPAEVTYKYLENVADQSSL